MSTTEPENEKVPSTRHSITFIADKSKEALSEGFIRQVTEFLAAKGIDIEGIDWLAPDIACDIIFSQIKAAQAEPYFAELVGDLPFDWVIQPAQNRKKKMLISDMDSTLITVECIDELADFVGMKEKVADITQRAMNGELEFRDALTERVKLLAGMPEKTLQQVYDKRVKYMAGAKELVATMRRWGAHCVLVSGGFTFFTERVRDHLGFHLDSSNRLSIKKGKLTGEVIEPILDKDAKVSTLKQEAAAHRVSLEDVLAIGDGANDLPMLLASGLGVAYHAKPNVRAAANYRIMHTDLTSMLYIQGYKQHEIVDSYE